MSSRLDGALASASLIALRAMPLATRVAVQERLETVGRLDHPRYEIEIDVESQIELFRLGSCAKEPETVAWLDSALRPGECFYDIGANIGAYSLVGLHALERRGRVVSFEPGFATFPKLVTNVILNDASDVVLPLNVALGEQGGLTRLNYSTLLPGGAMHGFDAEPQASKLPATPSMAQDSSNSVWQDVLTYRLDELVEGFDLASPNHLKLDVDGAEMAVLRGAGDMLAAPELRSVLVEVDEREADETDRIVGLIEGSGLELTEKHKHSRSGVSNYIFYRR